MVKVRLVCEYNDGELEEDVWEDSNASTLLGAVANFLEDERGYGTEDLAEFQEMVADPEEILWVLSDDGNTLAMNGDECVDTFTVIT